MIRRTFIKAGVLTAGSWGLPIIRQDNERIRLGIIGTGWWGTDYLLRFANESGEFDIVALCDVCRPLLENAAAKLTEAGGTAPKLYHEHEALMDHPGLQAVVIATPTHWHALQFIDACQRGLHIWQEKPVSYDIREAQAMYEAYKKAGNVVNVDFPRLHAPINDQVKDYLRSGQLGEVYQVEFNIHNPEGIPVAGEVPGGMDYDRFCGPAPLLPYIPHPSPGRCNWRLLHGFSRGILADWGIHYLQNIHYILDLGLPSSVSAIGGITHPKGQEHPNHLQVHFDYDGLPVHWNHKTWGFTSPMPHTRIGIYFYGDKGTLFAADSGWEVYSSNGSQREYGNVRVGLQSDEYEAEIRREFLSQFKSFAQAIRDKSDNRIKGSFKEGFHSTCAVTYADLAYRSGQIIHIDHQTMNTPGNEKAQAMLMRTYRGPYQHPYQMKKQGSK